MSEYTPITGELRDTLERAKCTFTNSAGFEQVNVTKDALDSMLDAIDAIHANLERENDRLRCELDRVQVEQEKAKSRTWTLGYDEGFASADDWMADNETVMNEHGWVRLPVDADGETIHIGEAMEGADGYLGGVWLVGLNEVMFDNHIVRYAKTLHHVKPDTWERIEEDARKAMSLYSMPNVVMTLVARCKALACGAK